jgi:hypothetical protein
MPAAALPALLPALLGALKPVLLLLAPFPLSDAPFVFQLFDTRHLAGLYSCKILLMLLVGLSSSCAGDSSLPRRKPTLPAGLRRCCMLSVLNQ